MAKNSATTKKGARRGPPRNSGEVRLSEHPRARRHIGLAKSWAGLIAFALAGYLAWKGGASFVDMSTRALMWGLASYVLVWALAVQVWRQLAVAEVRAAERRWAERKGAEEEQVRKLTAILEDNNMPTTGSGTLPGM